MITETQPEDLRVTAGIKARKVPVKISPGLRIAVGLCGAAATLGLASELLAKVRGVRWPNPEFGQIYEVCIGRTFSCTREYLTHHDLVLYQIAQTSTWGLIAGAVFVVFHLALGARRRNRAK